MTFKEKCLKIVELVYSAETFNENDLYSLIFSVVQTSAYKKKLFRYYTYYDDFCHYMSGVLYMRLIDKDKPKIKSVSNYINRTILGFRDNFSKAEFSQSFDIDSPDGPEIAFALEEMLKDSRCSANDSMNRVYIDTYIDSIPKQIKSYVEDSRYANDAVKNYNVYVSVLLSVLTGRTRGYRLTNEETEYLGLLVKDVKARLGADVIKAGFDDEFRDQPFFEDVGGGSGEE